MKVIIAGGRDYIFSIEDINLLDDLHKEHDFSEVVSGGAWGADFEGEQWAARNGIFVKKFPADWNKHGRAAGPIRNKQMAQYADALITFKGGRGTANMKNQAREYGLNILHQV